MPHARMDLASPGNISKLKVVVECQHLRELQAQAPCFLDEKGHSALSTVTQQLKVLSKVIIYFFKDSN